MLERPHDRMSLDGTHSPTADLAVRAVAGNVPPLRHTAVRAARWIGLDESIVKRMALAVSEAATNAVLHAFPDGPGTVHLVVFEDDSVVEVVVADDGIGLTPRADSPGLGLGLGLIAEIADELRIRTPPSGGTEIRMRFDRA
jgi:serine/threonine-protein kinase RsbW